MTLATTTNKVTYAGNGATTSFSYGFQIPSSLNVQVIIIDANGNATTLTSAQYSITGIGSSNGGVVVYPLSGSPLASGKSLTITRIVPYIQQTSLINQSGYYPDVVEGALDNLTMQTQQLAEQYGRVLQFPISDISPVINLPPAAARKNQALIFDSSGNPTTGASASVNVSSPMIPIVQASSIFSAVNLLQINSSQVSHTQGGTGAITRNAQEALRDTPSVFGYMSPAQIADVIANTKTIDMQPSITAAITANRTLRFPHGTYLLNSYALLAGILFAPSNTTLYFDNVTFFIGAAMGTEKLAFVLSDPTYLLGVNNIRFYGKLTIDGNRANRSGSLFSGIGLYIACGKDINIEDLAIINCPSDGIAVQGDTTTGGLSENVVIERLFLDNNYRNGQSCTGTRACNFPVVWAQNTNGASPEAGIDCEPDGPTSPNIDLHFGDVRCTGNNGNGFLVANSSSGQSIIIDSLFSSSNHRYGYNSTASHIDCSLLSFNGGGNGIDIGGPGAAYDFAPNTLLNPGNSNLLSSAVDVAAITFNGTGVPVILGRYNFGPTVTRTAVGRYSLVFAPSLLDTKYGVIITCLDNTGEGIIGNISTASNPKTINGFDIVLINPHTNAFVDSTEITVRVNHYR